MRQNAPKIPGKRCSKCRGVFPLSRFHKDKGRKDGRHPHCSGCVTAYQRKWVRRPDVRERNTERQRNYARRPERKAQIIAYQNTVLASGLTRLQAMKLKSRYGLSEADYLAMLQRQEFVCATCPEPFDDKRGPQVDHCHETGVVRGLLCPDCNRALGMVKERVATLRKMISYLGGRPDETSAG